MSAPKRLPRTGIQSPNGRDFPWGPIDAIHSVGPYQIVEYREDKSNSWPDRYWVNHGRTLFHPFIDGEDTNESFLSLDSALIGAIARRREGPNGLAARYFDLMTLGAIEGES